jgi:hypothetical protein
VQSAFQNVDEIIEDVNRPNHLEHNLLALYFNLATRRLNAGKMLSKAEKTKNDNSAFREWSIP